MIEEIKLSYTGITSLLMNNPQMVDPLNEYTKRLAVVNKKRNKTEEDHLHRYDLEIAAKIYWKDDLGVCIPTSWVIASICKSAFKVGKISKADIRSIFFPHDEFVKLKYKGERSVKCREDIIKSDSNRWLFPTKQGQVKVMKAFPIFEGWSFEVDAEFDNELADKDTIKRIAEHGAKYTGFGDFRPTFGRAAVEVS